MYSFIQVYRSLVKYVNLCAVVPNISEFFLTRFGLLIDLVFPHDDNL